VKRNSNTSLPVQNTSRIVKRITITKMGKKKRYLNSCDHDLPTTVFSCYYYYY